MRHNEIMDLLAEKYHEGDESPWSEAYNRGCRTTEILRAAFDWIDELVGECESLRATNKQLDHEVARLGYQLEVRK